MTEDPLTIAAGIGCRRGCAARDIVEVLGQALAASAESAARVGALYAPDFKHDERGLADAAAQLGLSVVLLPLAALRTHAARAFTRSERVMQAYGVPSIAETAACAGAAFAGGSAAPEAGSQLAPGPHLLGPRVSVGGATCALAVWR